MIRQLAYISSATRPQTTAQLQDIARRSLENNEARGITGLLFASGGWFFQVVEGRRARVDPLFETLRRDPRHRGVTKLFECDLERRCFPGRPLILTLLGHPDGSILVSSLFRGVDSTLATHLGGETQLGQRVRDALAKRGIRHG